MNALKSGREAAVLVAVQLPDATEIDHQGDIAELGRLVDTLGYDVIGIVGQRRPSLAKGGVLGQGKLLELAAYTGGTGDTAATLPNKKPTKARARRDAEQGAGLTDKDALGDDEADDDFEDDEADDDASEGGALYAGSRRATLVVVDHEITPSQARNLERATGASVLDRTGVIVEIFHRHARSREARLQVEIARLAYVAPRLREAGGAGEKQAGRGAGETALELDRRRIRDRIAELRIELEAIRRDHQNRREQRREQRRVALVGYTNAGKSSLMRALTGGEVLVADRLFATLDTTVRALAPEVKPRILVSDTVGFIKKLPHDLVASFRSTLDEALEASLLLFVVDASDPTYEAQLAVTHEVLGDIGAGEAKRMLVLNKIDRVPPEARDSLIAAHPGALLISTREPADVKRIRQAIVDFFDASLAEAELYVPYARMNVIGEVREEARVVEEQYDEGGLALRVRAEPAVLARLRALVDVATQSTPPHGDDELHGS